ncbi:hypothetical protein H2201_001243 [Coniosporium apollinis]|uniref:Pyrroloquinoline quinone-dependent pyranose dehydrogenase beta-propeller domain-containing protein n=2 Tax=Coniosporium TaxID=2810619 RepID=A0ABQ9P5I9_9PEZI|nr:hypothetical protein H2199_001653 [Cladosporium sp. JES 115]KAJ9668601.1 hypothetical protein H2201_001243 [Coniosporium apollinis]
MPLPRNLLLAFNAWFITAVVAQSSASCSTTLTARYPAPSIADGYQARLVATNLDTPRGIKVDRNGNLLIVTRDAGIVALSLTDEEGGCITAADVQTVVENNRLNHGIELSHDGTTLYASTPNEVYAWTYNPDTRRTSGEPRTLITGMDNAGHTTRTLLLSRHVPDLLLVSRGSNANLDYLALDITSGHCQLKAFNISNVTSEPYDFTADGRLLGWGLRNSVGVAEEPVTGGIYSVENSVDQLRREGQDIHQDNPGEEMNFHGYLNGTRSAQQGGNYGYPSCFAAWAVDEIPENDGLTVGSQFAIGDQDTNINDAVCAERIAPRLTFPAHMAPLDILFNEDGTAAWVSFHGSWNRDDPIGYKLSVIPFANGEPVEPSNSSQPTVDIMQNSDIDSCPDNCFRPVGLAWDSQGRLFMTSDDTGEIYVITRTDGGNTSSATPTTGLPPAGTSSGGAVASTTASAASRATGNLGALSLAVAVVSLSL